MTEQHHEKQCNINNIMARYEKTGLIDHINRIEGNYGDATGADFKTALDLVKREEANFAELPAKIRAELNDDPAEYLDLVATDEGVKQMADLLFGSTKTDQPEKPEPDVPEPTKEPADPAVT